VVVIEGQGDIAIDLAALDDRHGPAHDAAEALANRIFSARIGRVFRFEGLAGLFQRSRQVGADDLRWDVGTDDVGNVDFASLEFFELGK
jgi:hypothetical protein